MSKKRIVTIVLGIVLLAVMMSSLLLSDGSTEQYPALRTVSLICALAAVASAIIYYSYYGKKQGRLFFAIFGICTGLNYYLSLLQGMLIGRSVLSSALSTLAFGLICAMIVAKDLGRTKSFVLAILIAALKLLPVILTATQDFALGELLASICSAILAFVLLTLVELKYIDKKERNRK